MSTFLVVDDIEENRYLLKSLLTVSGDEDIEAENGVDALEKAHQIRPDLIISDILMPQMDGFSFCRACKSDDQLKKIPFVFYSATYKDKRDKELAMRLGAVRYITKPIDNDELVSIINEIITEGFDVDYQETSPKQLEPSEILDEENTFFRMYNEVLIRKLEDKMLELEVVNQNLKESEKRYRLLSENAHDIIFRYELINNIGFSYINPAVTMISDYQQDEFYENPDMILNIIHPDDRFLLENALSLQSGFQDTLTLRWLRKNGEIVWIEQRNVPIYDEQGELIAIEGIARDVTEQKQHLRELEIIAKMSKSFRVAEERCEMIPIILDQVISLIPVESALLATVDLDNEELLIELGRGKWQKFTGLNFPAESRISEKLLSISSSYQTNNLTSENFSFMPEELISYKVVAVTPLKVRTQIIGFLLVGGSDPIRIQDQHLLNAIADIAASAIHRAALFEETKKRVQQLQTLRMIDRAISSNFALEVTFNILMDHCKLQLGADAVGLLIYKPDIHTLNYAAELGFLGKSYLRSNLKLGEGQAGKVAVNRQMIQIQDLNTCKPPFSRTQLLNEEGFVSYAAAPLLAKGQLKGVLEVFHRYPFQHDDDWMIFLEALSQQAAIAIDNTQLFENLQKSNIELFTAYDSTIEGWSRALELRDKETEGHSSRVTNMTLRLATRLGVQEKDLVHVKRGALLHDIGKMGIPDNILSKPTTLNEEEWEIMRMHPVYAFNMLSQIDYLKPALDIPYYHHERWDGSGYPRGLKGRQIPLFARIFMVVDVWDALTSDRPYRKAWSEKDALNYIKENSGRLFDPQVVELFFEILKEND